VLGAAHECSVLSSRGPFVPIYRPKGET
jgi:hypothetical protein